MRQTLTLTPRTRRLLDIQGFDTVDSQALAPVAPWLRLTFGLCALIGGIRHLTGTGPLPKRGAPTRFGCGMGAVLVLVTAWAFSAGHLVVGYALGGMLTFVVLLATTDLCIPSLIYRSIFGWPR